MQYDFSQVAKAPDVKDLKVPSSFGPANLVVSALKAALAIPLAPLMGLAMLSCVLGLLINRKDDVSLSLLKNFWYTTIDWFDFRHPMRKA